MRSLSRGLIIGISIGVVIGLLLALGALFFIRCHRRRSQLRSGCGRTPSALPMRTNGADTSSMLSDSTTGLESPKHSRADGTNRKNIISMSGIPKYSYKDLQKATKSFTTVIGKGAFGTVYIAKMSTGETVAVKVLAANSKHGEKEFQSEVLLLGRLHHRNLVNLVGYCSEKSQNMLIYVYMPNGSLDSHLYEDKHEPLSWDMRVYIALDVARGVEYLHDGANPPIVHRDIKSSNILLDQSMRARVADFGLSREVNPHESNIRGTLGYLDPEYVSMRKFTKKSDVYSFGVLLFELITGRNPQQGLMEYIELAAINAEGSNGWEEIVDSRIEGRYDVKELNDIAVLAYKCISRLSKKRPSMRDIVQALCRILKDQHSSKHHHRDSSLTTLGDDFDVAEPAEVHISVANHSREESAGSISDFSEV